MTTPTPLFDPPKVHELPLTRHSDLYIDFKRKVRTGGTDDAPIYEYEDYPPGTTAVLYIDTKAESIPVPVEITGYHAIAWLQSEVIDLIKSGTWAYKIAYASSGPSPIDKVPVNGPLKRYDGNVAVL